ncbi:MAG: beta-glucosidase [Clostridiales bacterium]|nr:beta-glucosidase [Clostridiales bacterium]
MRKIAYEKGRLPHGFNLDALPRTPLPEFDRICRRAAAEGIVLLRNENNTLPLRRGETVSLFGRAQLDYVKSGTGSGGLVHPPYVINIVDGLIENGSVKLNEELLSKYREWIRENPYDNGHGWATEPWSQKEYVPDEELVRRAAASSDAAVIVIGRTAGEDRDITGDKGSYNLSDEERELLRLVTSHFKRVVVALNVGGIIDMKWVDEYKIGAVIYLWQGGQEGGRAAADVLTGVVSPCGKLADTIAYDITDYPSHKNFGGDNYNLYEEDIYVGYRYFETFAPDRVMFPFGFGLSYTTFKLSCDKVTVRGGKRGGRIYADITVVNTGSMPGREVVQIYFEAPQGVLGKPARVLCAFGKTKTILPGGSQKIQLSFPISSMASYDDGGFTGYKSSYVLEAGDYHIYAGADVRSAERIFTYNVPKTIVTQRLTEAMSPSREFYRIKPGEKITTEGTDKPIRYSLVRERVPMRSYDVCARIEKARESILEHKYTGDVGIKLRDVYLGNSTIDEFIAQLTNEELAALSRGEGINSKRRSDVWTTAVIGGVTDSLVEKGIPVSTNTDGPSGIRSDSGEQATLMPCGTLIGCTWDTALAEEMFIYEGLELRARGLDALLGPGMNIHRHPYNGRNFEYFSEDPLLTGKMAAAETRGAERCGVSTTLKHFAANNQEKRRHDCDSVMSERAAREIYLRGFEIAVREGNARAIMTSYNPINGIYSAGNYDLLTTILRGEWGFTGFVMTDWWAKVNYVGCVGSQKARGAMVRAQNDVYMVVSNAEAENDSENGDDILSCLSAGIITRGELERNAKNILNYIMKTPTFEKTLIR